LLTAFDNYGKEIYTWHSELKTAGILTKEITNSFSKQEQQKITVQETDTLLQLSAADISITLDKRTGLLTDVTNSKAAGLAFNNGPVLINGSFGVEKLAIQKSEDSVSVHFYTTGDMQQLSWTMFNTGWVQLQYVYGTAGRNYNMAGVSFHYPENYVLSASWLGKGPARQWRNRLKGTEKSVYRNMYNNTQTGYSPVVYPEFKGYYGDISWIQVNTVQGSFLMVAKDTGLYVRLFDFYGLTGISGTPQLPAGNISFMDIIPAVGTKLALGVNNNTTVLGPEGQMPVLQKAVSRTLLFYFGTPEGSNKKETYSRPAVDEVF
jgi:hypothetical protein